MRGYVGSVAASVDGSHILVSSPRGGILMAVDARTLKPVFFEGITDICGIGADEKGWLFSSGGGRLGRTPDALRHNAGWAWDNHLAVL